MWSKLSGKKTFIVCAVGVLWAVIGAVLGYLSPEESLNIVLASLGGAGLRAGMSK